MYNANEKLNYKTIVIFCVIAVHKATPIARGNNRGLSRSFSTTSCCRAILDSDLARRGRVLLKIFRGYVHICSVPGSRKH